MPNDPAELTSAWFDAWRTKDANAVERMIAADYFYVAPNGAVMDREAILGISRIPAPGLRRARTSKLQSSSSDQTWHSCVIIGAAMARFAARRSSMTTNA